MDESETTDSRELVDMDIDRYNEQKAKCRKELLTRYEITEEELSKNSIEGRVEGFS